MRFVRILFSLFIIFSIVFSLTFAKDKIGEKPLSTDSNTNEIILTLWHIDTFEGGFGSRKQFLMDRAIEFEKTNKNVLIRVVSKTIESYYECIKNNESPDMISYGLGIEVLNPLEIDYKFNGAMIYNKCYAVPWCKGNYVLLSKSTINNDIKKLIVSKCQYNNPLVAFLESDYKVLEISEKEPLEAYIDFINSKDSYLLGTQRDVVRLMMRKIDFSIKVLSGFNDLYQYISVLTNDYERYKLSADFIDFLISEKTQNKLTKISMLSEYYNLEYGDRLNELQIIHNEKTFSIFLNKEQLIEIDSLALKNIRGEIKDDLKIKNLYV